MKATSSRNLDAAHSLVALAHCMDHQNQNSHFHRQYTPRIIIPVHGTSQLMHSYHDRNSPTSTGSSCYSSNWTSDQSSSGTGLVSSPSPSKSPTSPISPSFPITSSSSSISPSKQTILTFQVANNKTQVIVGANPLISHPSLLVSTSNNPTINTVRGDNSAVGSSSTVCQNDDIVPSSPSLILDNDGSLFMVARILADLKSVKQDHPSGSPAPVLPHCSSPSMTAPTSTTGDHFNHHRTLDGSLPRKTRVQKGCSNRYICSYPGCGKMYGEYTENTC